MGTEAVDVVEEVGVAVVMEGRMTGLAVAVVQTLGVSVSTCDVEPLVARVRIVVVAGSGYLPVWPAFDPVLVGAWIKKTFRQRLN